jgi:hypothetical protein
MTQPLKSGQGDFNAGLIQDFQYSTFAQFGCGGIDNGAQRLSIPALFSDDLAEILLRCAEFNHGGLLTVDFTDYKLIRIIRKSLCNHLNQFFDLTIAHSLFPCHEEVHIDALQEVEQFTVRGIRTRKRLGEYRPPVKNKDCQPGSRHALDPAGGDAESGRRCC